MPFSAYQSQRVQHDLVERLLAGQHRRQQDAVVVGVRLGAEHRDVVEIGRDLQQLLERAHAGHAVADHHELHFFHDCPPVGFMPCALDAGDFGRARKADDFADHNQRRAAQCGGARGIRQRRERCNHVPLQIASCRSGWRPPASSPAYPPPAAPR